MLRKTLNVVVLGLVSLLSANKALATEHIPCVIEATRAALMIAKINAEPNEYAVYNTVLVHAPSAPDTVFNVTLSHRAATENYELVHFEVHLTEQNGRCTIKSVVRN